MQPENMHIPVEHLPTLVPLSWGGDQLTAQTSIDTILRPNSELTILHTGDLHSSVDGRSTADGTVYGGLARIATTIRQARTAGPTLVLDTGDLVFGEGTRWNAHGATAVAQLRAIAGCDLATIGNHDVERGQTSLQELIQGGISFVSANLNVDNPELQALILPAYIANIGGWRVGISGITTLATFDYVPHRIMQGITLSDPQEAITRAVRAIEPMVDTIVVLSHLGYYEDGRGDYALAAHLAGSKVSVIVGGHTHNPLQPAPTIAGIVVCNAGSQGKYVDEIKLRWSAPGVIRVKARLLLQDETIADDADLLAARSAIQQNVLEADKTRFSLPSLPKPGDTASSRHPEYALLAKALSAAGVADPEAALFIPLIYVVGRLPAESYATTTDILTVYPNLEYLVEAEISGKALKELLTVQHSFLSYEQAYPLWLNDERPVQAEQLQDESIYKLLITELMLQGHLGWSQMRHELRHSRMLDVTCSQVVLDYLQGRSIEGSIK
jgi:5'-nucleotidase